ncbi:paramyosin-like [Seriola dumerili]|uniref:paramyosin-like n=1 Tax=Seriola dumerili TaxID=41447 RepID=UPI000BBE34C4|nr:paramyosin-like [Seriola dumerili]
MKQSPLDLQSQLQMKQEEDILPGIENCREESGTQLKREVVHLDEGENETFEAKICDIQHQVEDAQNKDELIEKQNREISPKQEIIKEYNKLQTDMNQILLENRTCHENNAELQSEVRALEVELNELRAKERNYTKQQEELHKVHSQLEGLNSELGVKILEVTELKTENSRLQESVSKIPEIKEELAQVSNLLSQEQSLRQKNDIYIRQLEEEKLVLSQTKDNITVDLTRLESLRESQRIENENLLAEIHILKENEKGINEKNKSLTAELTHLEHIKQGEIESLRAAVSDLQCQVEDAQQVNLKKGEQCEKQNSEIANQQQVMEVLDTLKIDMKQTLLVFKNQLEMWQLDDLMPGIENIREESGAFGENLAQLEMPEGQRDENLQEMPAAGPQQLDTPVEKAQQDNSDKDGLLEKVVELKHLTEKLQSENKMLLATVQNLQGGLNSLGDQNMTINAELVLLESQTEKKEAENDNLKAEIYALQAKEKMLNEKNNNLIDEVADLEYVRERNQQQIESLRAAVCDLQCQVKESQEVHRDKEEVTQKLTHVESLMEKKQIEMEKLRTALHHLQEKEEFLNEQNNMVTAELAQLESLKEKQNEENKKLKTAVQDLQYRVEETHLLILNKDELIAKQNNEIAYKQQLVEEYYTLTTEIRQSLHDLENQLEMRQEEEKLAGIKNFREESRFFFETTEQLEMPEEQRDESLQATPAAEPQQLETPVREPQQLETLAAEPQQLKTPVREPQWCHSAKRLLNVGLHIGIATVATLIPAAILTTQLTANCSTNPSCCECAFQLLEPYCQFQQGQRPI